ncbi:MAG: tetratricopeptide repeat protein [Ginsengibacter sp.]
MKYLVAWLFFNWVTHAEAQTKAIDSLNLLISKSKSDTQRINLKTEKLRVLSNGNLDSAIAFARNIIEEAKRTNYKKGEAAARISLAGDYCFAGEYAVAKENLDAARRILSNITDSASLGKMYDCYGMMCSMQNKFDTSHTFYKKAIEIATLQNDKSLLLTILQNDAIAFQQQSDYPQALTNYQNALKVAEQIHDEEGQAFIYLNIAITYNSLDESKRAEQSYLKAVDLAKKLNLKNVLAYSYANLSSLYSGINDFKKEYDFGIKAAILGKEIGDKGIEASSLSRAALALASQNKFEEAEKLNEQARNIADSSQQPLNIYQAYGDMGSILTMQKNYSKAIPYFEKAFHSLKESDIYAEEIGRSYANLSKCYEQTGDFNKALATYKIAAKISDSIRGRENVKKATELTMNFEFEKKQQLAKGEQQKQNDLAKTKQAALIIGLILAFLLAAVAFNGFRNKRKANLLLQQQKIKVESTLSELKSTQTQLIQSEKMASLGELTAGIAHEIQNPLNFVNNFSEVNKEMLEELKAERLKPNAERNDDLQNDLIDDVINNSEKINHHGKRADAIVKGMLQHSRTSTGQKELTDINALADEYLRLSYHGIRAKDKEFNAEFKTDFDNSIGKINIVPQDIGRVLLNLYNNAFYAVNEKKKQVGDGYEPAVSASTKKIADKISISVQDNGNGIPQNIVDKIFQPFFTTKPTGEGTGLGLSLSYDIIKAHGGEIKVETKEGEGTKFIIFLSNV